MWSMPPEPIVTYNEIYKPFQLVYTACKLATLQMLTMV
jgi:hypothetical protein